MKQHINKSFILLLFSLASWKKTDLQHSMERGEWDNQTLLMEFLFLGLGDVCEL